MTLLPPRVSVVGQIAAVLKEGIRTHEWDQWLPGERELCGQLQVARMTLRAGLKRLRDEGWVRTQPGKRTSIVARPKRVRPVVGNRVLLLTSLPLESLRAFTILCISELQEHLAQAGYHLELHPTHGHFGQTSVQTLAALIQQLRPAGCVLTASNRKLQEWASTNRLPCVILGSPHPAVNLPSVDIAYRAVCRHAAGQFLRRGHRRLVLLNPDMDAAGDLESEQGFNEAAAGPQGAGAEVSVIRHNGTVSGICKKIDLLLRQPEPPTAMLVSRPGHMLTVMSHLHRRGLRVPQDMALISRDHDSFLSEVVPSIARYVTRPALLARQVGRMVLSIARDRWIKPQKYVITPSFCLGDTLGIAHPGGAADRARR